MAKKTKIGRNDPCPCGSGKKYKKCCMEKFENSQDDKFVCPICGGTDCVLVECDKEGNIIDKEFLEGLNAKHNI